MEDEFYMTLLSNSSMAYYPDNKISSFNVHLSREINLEGRWSTAVTEITYPKLIENVREEHNHVIVSIKWYCKGVGLIHFDDQKVQIETGVYTTEDELVNAINKAFNWRFGCNLLEKSNTPVVGCLKIYQDEWKMLDNFIEGQEIDKRAAVAKLNLSNYLWKALNQGIFNPHVKIMHIGGHGTSEISIKFAGMLGLQLGFPPDTPLKLGTESLRRTNISHGIDSQVFVYLDLIEPQLVSDYACQVARIVKTTNISSQSDDVTSHEFIHRNYLPLVKNRFQTVNVALRDSLGNLVPFNIGHSCITLHFRKTS